MHELDKTSKENKTNHISLYQKKNYLLQQHDNQVKYPLNLMLMYDDRVYVDKVLYFHVEDQEPKNNDHIN
jgi:hypothetical protein